MRKLKGTLLTLLAQQSGQINLLIVAPILTLSFLSLVVRTASSAVDSSAEKKKVTEQLKRRLSEVQNERPAEGDDAKTLAHSQTLLSAKFAPQKHPLKVPASQPPRLILQQHSPAQQLMLPLQANVKIGKKATLASLLSSEGIEKDELNMWLTAAKKQKELRRLTAGRTLELSFASSKKDKDRELHALAYDLDKKSRFVLEKKADGKIAARKEQLPITLVWKAVGGRITGSLYKAALKAGLPKQLLDDLADMDWDIDLTSDLQPNDTFKVIFEEYEISGKPVEHGRILAAEISNKGKTHVLFSFPDPPSVTVRSKSRGTFLRYPLQFTRITSVFTDARLHPILERVRPHTGIDFSAPRGTPVRAVSSGKVTFAGRQSGYGNIVRIDHPGPYDTAYAHLDRIAESAREGATVEKGQIIGFVGATGLATGPHLHFEMYKDGSFINPLTAKLPLEDKLPQKDNPVFMAKKQRALEQFGAMKIGEQPVVLSMAAPLSGKSSSRETAEKAQEKRMALATSNSPSFIPGLSSSEDTATHKRSVRVKEGKKRQRKETRVTASRHPHVVVIKAGKIVEANGQHRKASSHVRHVRSRGVRTARR
ncbi:MAG: M23 family metallopeptidase [Deltaproteobacteria bacterium]|nr:M23 family metallopeptidase [Deltaproteobacteria bacterium]